MSNLHKGFVYTNIALVVTNVSLSVPSLQQTAQ